MKTDPSIIEDSLEPAEKPVILIVDDSRVIRLALKKILKKEFIIHEANDGEEAWTALLEDSSIQVVFSDLYMPELDGFGLLDRLRNSEDERIKNLPFIVITGNEDDEGIMQEALDNGANDLITKPFQSKEIKERAYAFARIQADDLKPDSVLVDVSAGLADSITSKDQYLNEAKQIALDAEREAVRTQEEEEMRRKAAEETTTRIKEEVEERRRKMELDEKAVELVAVKILPKVTEASREEASIVEDRIQVEVEARKKAEDELARFKQQMEEQKEKEKEKEATVEVEKSALQAKIEENNFQQVDMELAKYKDSAKEEIIIIANDVRNPVDHIRKGGQIDDIDNRQNNEETKMIRVELERKLQLEREHHEHTADSFFIRLAVWILVIANALPGVRLDDTINDLKKRF